MAGIRTIDDLKARCYVDDATGCWEWRAGRNGAGEPSFRFPPLGQRVVSLGTAIAFFRTAKPSPKGVVWYCRCDTPHCANPQHRRKGTRAERVAVANGVPSAARVAKVTAWRRSVSKVSDADCRAIRESTETSAAIAARYGISTSYANRIKRGQYRTDAPLRGASVFNLGLNLGSIAP